MAGAGFKTFNTGDVLTASDVNTYLMQQTTMVFADASARSTALGANVAEGMISYLKDTNAVERYDGSSWGAIGAGDIEGVTAGAGLSGGGTSGTVTLNLNSLAAGRNAVINGSFDIWQRGTSFALSTGTYNADRWSGYRGVAGSTISRQTTSDTTNLPNVQYCSRVQRDSGNTNTTIIYQGNNFESINSIPFAGRTITLSFYARKGGNFSAASDIMISNVATGTGTDQNQWTGFTGVTNDSKNNTLTTTWQRFSHTVTIASNTTQIAIYFAFTPVGTAGAADYFEVTGVQLELGSSATPFSRAGGTIQGELAACQRYYVRLKASGANYPFGMAQNYTTSTGGALVPFPVTMRTRPTALETTGSGGDYQVYTASGTARGLASAPTFAGVVTTEQMGAVNYTTTLTDLVAGNANQFVAQTSSGYLGWSAEL